MEPIGNPNLLVTKVGKAIDQARLLRKEGKSLEAQKKRAEAHNVLLSSVEAYIKKEGLHQGSKNLLAIAALQLASGDENLQIHRSLRKRTRSFLEKLEQATKISGLENHQSQTMELEGGLLRSQILRGLRDPEAARAVIGYLEAKAEKFGYPEIEKARLRKEYGLTYLAREDHMIAESGYFDKNREFSFHPNSIACTFALEAFVEADEKLSRSVLDFRKEAREKGLNAATTKAMVADLRSKVGDLFNLRQAAKACSRRDTRLSIFEVRYKDDAPGKTE